MSRSTSPTGRASIRSMAAPAIPTIRSAHPADLPAAARRQWQADGALRIWHRYRRVGARSRHISAGCGGTRPPGALSPNMGTIPPALSRREGFVAAHDSPLSIAGCRPRAQCRRSGGPDRDRRRSAQLRRRAKPLEECRLLAITMLPGAPVDASVAEPVRRQPSETLARAGIAIDPGKRPAAPTQGRNIAAYPQDG